MSFIYKLQSAISRCKHVTWREHESGILPELVNWMFSIIRSFTSCGGSDARQFITALHLYQQWSSNVFDFNICSYYGRVEVHTTGGLKRTLNIHKRQMFRWPNLISWITSNYARLSDWCQLNRLQTLKQNMISSSSAVKNVFLTISYCERWTILWVRSSWPILSVFNNPLKWDAQVIQLFLAECSQRKTGEKTIKAIAKRAMWKQRESLLLSWLGSWFF